MGRVMPHPAEPTTEQAGTVAQLKRLVNLWLEDITEVVEVKKWEKESQDLGDMHTGKRLTS